MKPPSALPPCYQPQYVSGACPVCGEPMNPPHFVDSRNWLGCGACCVICLSVEPLADGPVRGNAGTQEVMFGGVE